MPQPPTNTNQSILRCPECGHGLVNIGSRIERNHPIPCFVKNRYAEIHIAWLVLLLPVILVIAVSTPGRSGGFAIFGLFFVPSFFLYFLVRAFPLYRITDGPYCGFTDSQRLGHSHIS